MKKYIFAFLSTIFSWPSIYSRQHSGIFIIIPGTWSIQANWHNPEGKFFTSLEENAQKYNKNTCTYLWPGKNSHQSRVLAAQGLAKLIESYPKNLAINIIAHSHGANVAMLASQILSKKNRIIQNLITLGVPVDTQNYAPSLDVIKKLYNIFSLNDFVQPVVGFFQRTYEQHQQIKNIRLLINNNEPSHSKLHSSILAKHIPTMIFEENNEILSYNNPLLKLFDDKPHIYQEDEHRDYLLEEDISLNQRLPSLFTRKIKWHTKSLKNNDKIDVYTKTDKKIQKQKSN